MPGISHQVFRLILSVSLLLFFCCFAQAANAQKTAVLININGGIGPATQDFVERGIKQAQQQEAAVVILKLDTPGGLGKSMRGIIKAILSSPVPVVTYVAPSGARAASAGTYILYASQIAAMAPGTNLGAATPVSLSPQDKINTKKKQLSASMKKAVNDASAYIKSLAELRGRNAEWAQLAVREGASLSAQEALEKNVVNVIADNVPDLLKKINGMQVKVQGQEKTLQTDNLSVTTVKPDWRTKLLSVITDPSVAYILLLVGIYGIFFEFSNPGLIIPGVVGVVSILLALYAFQLLPISYIGLALLLFGIAFMVAEAFVPSFGALGIGGIVAFIAGSVLLIDTGDAGYRIAMPVIASVSAVTAGFFLLVVNMALRSRYRPIVSGSEELANSEGTVIDEAGMQMMRIRGERWQVKSAEPLSAGDKVKVVDRNGLTLIVKKL